MKISVITLHRVFNYGSVLQALATQKIIEKLGHEAEIIDYIPINWQNKALYWNIIESRGFLKDNIYRFARVFSIILKKRTFWRFLEKNLHMTKTYYSFDEICADPPKADIYCTGSDQVWNSTYCGIDRAFYLDFGDKTKKRIAFSASFGATELSDYEKEQIKPYLSKYSSLTVRETDAQTILNGMGFQNELIIDPTLLIPKEEWLAISSKRLIKEKYLILMLLYSEDNNATEYARKIADEKGLKLVKISWDLKKPDKVDILMTHRKPEDFISLFNHAEYVVTNSFHGLAFSINLNKQFMIIKRNEFNSRIDSLLNITGLGNRLVDKQLDMSVVNSFIDYEPINKILEEKRNAAEAILTEALDG